MKKIALVFGLLVMVGFSALAQKPEHLDEAGFKAKVYDFDKSKTWKYEGNTPAIVDFYADWCGPCRYVAPFLEQLANEYGTKIKVYKVNTDKEQQLSASLGIQNLPTIIFIPQNGQPQTSMGAIPKETLVKAINDVLLVR